MRKVVVTEYLTLDGVMEAPNKWSFPFWGDEAAKYKYDELFASDAMLLGRVTYDGFAAAWPTMPDTGDFGERMNGMRKYVVSTTLHTAAWNNSELIKGDVVAAVNTLKQQPGQDILVAGSADLVYTLMQHDLVDELKIMLYPVVVGSGKRLFREGTDMKEFRLVETKGFGTGIAILIYQPAPRA